MKRKVKLQITFMELLKTKEEKMPDDLGLALKKFKCAEKNGKIVLLLLDDISKKILNIKTVDSYDEEKEYFELDEDLHEVNVVIKIDCILDLVEIFNVKSSLMNKLEKSKRDKLKQIIRRKSINYHQETLLEIFGDSGKISYLGKMYDELLHIQANRNNHEDLHEDFIKTTLGIYVSEARAS